MKRAIGRMPRRSGWRPRREDRAAAAERHAVARLEREERERKQREDRLP